MTSLEVTDLSVEAGGTTVVEGFSFMLRAGDKVGVVGRNGAGKTSTLKVLAGEAPAAAGTIVRRGALGYLRQDPRQQEIERHEADERSQDGGSGEGKRQPEHRSGAPQADAGFGLVGMAERVALGRAEDSHHHLTLVRA